MKRSSILLASRLATLAMVTLAVASCGKIGAGNPTSMTPAVVQPATTVAVKISGFAYHPPTVKIRVGTIVKWTDFDYYIHTVTARNGSFNSEDMGSGQSFSHTFKKIGKFPYYCVFHVGMTGTVIVIR